LYRRNIVFVPSVLQNSAYQPSPSVLIVEDDGELRQLMLMSLQDFGMHVEGAAGGAGMRAHLAARTFDVMLLDLMLPREDGLALCREVRAQYELAIIMVSARGELSDRVVGLEIGADDYLVKPFDMRELVARIRSVLRRSMRPPNGAAPPASSNVISFGPWRLDSALRQLLDANGLAIPLSNTEFRLIHVLLEHPRRVLNRDTLLDRARGKTLELPDRSIDLCISRLRRKLRDDPRDPKLIRTIRGEGYMLDAAVRR
jgi:two-component system OmpR family response regulator